MRPVDLSFSVVREEDARIAREQGKTNEEAPVRNAPLAVEAAALAGQTAQPITNASLEEATLTSAHPEGEEREGAGSPREDEAREKKANPEEPKPEAPDDPERGHRIDIVG